MPPGVEVRKGASGDRIRVTFLLNGTRKRETLHIPVTPANIKYAAGLRASIQNAVARGTFSYPDFFPNSREAKRLARVVTARPTVGKLIDDYLNTARRSESLSPSTIASYERWAKSRLREKWGDRLADEIQTPEIRSWIADLVGEMDVKSVRNCVGFLSSVLTRAAADSLIPANPMAPLKLKTVLPKQQKKEEAIDVDPFNDDEIAAILKACRTVEERALWQFAFATGLRTGELIGLKWGNIDEIRGVIRVTDNVVSGETGTVEKDTKTGEKRDVPILPAAREAIDAMRPITRVTAEYLFAHPGTRRRWLDDQQMRKGSWIPTLLRAGVRYRYPYQTRHTFASRLLMAGEPELLVAALLGHKTVEMIRRSYGKYIKQDDGIILRGDYGSFGAHLGRFDCPKPALNGSKPKCSKA